MWNNDPSSTMTICTRLSTLLLVSISNLLRLSTTRYSSLYTGTSTERDGFAKLLFVPFRS
jgi:hypothetical protein